MKFAIEYLEQEENTIKSMIDTFSSNQSKELKLQERLEEIQTAILVLNSSQEIVNIGRILALKNLQK